MVFVDLTKTKTRGPWESEEVRVGVNSIAMMQRSGDSGRHTRITFIGGTEVEFVEGRETIQDKIITALEDFGWHFVKGEI